MSSPLPRQMAVTFALLLFGCESGNELTWQASFADPADATGVVAFEAAISEEGCSGARIYTLQFPRAGFGEGVETPPALDPGTYGFSIRARDGECRVIAAGCEVVELPEASGVVSVVLTPSPGAAACASTVCSEGICGGAVGVDGGIDSVVPTECELGTANCNVDPGDGCEVVISSDLANCGGCGSACNVAHGTPSCTNAICEIVSCDAGWDDCDGDVSNGCETSLSTVADCGACRDPGGGPSCAFDHATASCDGGVCTFGECHQGWDDCDGDSSNGCEAPLNAGNNCGGCGNTCPMATPNCVLVGGTGACVDACPATAPTLCDTSCVDPMTDVLLCGGCAAGPCTLDNAAAACIAGTCTIEACNAEWQSCDANDATGCETLLTDGSNCGGCGLSCAAADAATSCVDGACVIDECFGARDDCNGIASDGCEADLGSAGTCGECTMACMAPSDTCGPATSGPSCVDTCPSPTGACGDRCMDMRFDDENCGICGNVCDLANASERCFFDACEVVECQDGFGDCDRVADNGCEAPLADDADNCGACGNVCTAGAGSEAFCSGGACGADCEPGLADCNGNPDDGCETPLDTLSDCGRCGNACSVTNGAAACTSGSCSVASCDANFEDCNGAYFDGCEVDTRTNVDNCGGCRSAGGDRCVGRTRLCCAGTCAETCP